jgi:hypothetical protein
VPVFSNEAGEPLKTFKKAWVVAVLKAHGVDPRWRKGRFETCSGTRRSSRPSDTTTRGWRHSAVERLETGKTFGPVRLKPDTTYEAADNLSAEAVSRDSAKAEVSRVFQVPAEQRFAHGEDPADKNRRSH